MFFVTSRDRSDKLGGDFGEALIASFSPTILDRNCVALNPASSFNRCTSALTLGPSSAAVLGRRTEPADSVDKTLTWFMRKWGVVLDTADTTTSGITHSETTSRQSVRRPYRPTGCLALLAPSPCGAKS
jgi:hypothetical protein